VILLVLVALLWIAVLAPSLWRRFSERQGVGSIDHFHHQLQLLEHAGPKTVSPAYRLHTAAPDGLPAEEATVLSVDSSRPKLVLLRPTDDMAAADVDDGQGGHYERVQVLDPPEPECVPDVGVDLRALRREQARRRCTMLVRCLAGVAVSTGLIGLLPGMHLAWVFTGLTAIALVGLLGLMAYAKELEAEQQRRRARHGSGVQHARHAWQGSESSPVGTLGDPVEQFDPVELVAVGSNGTADTTAAMRRQALTEGWDDVWEGDAGDFELPEVAAR